MRRLNEVQNPLKKVLFLGYDERQTAIVNALIEKGCTVDHTAEKIDGSGKYDLVISYGYRHILKKEIIDVLACPIFNLHISYLPYNKGAHPNFWSFYDNTPSGVTIHLIDDGVDTGPVVVQRYVNFSDDDDTFVKTYAVLINEIEKLFTDNLNSILSNKWTATSQRGMGTHHYVKDLPSNFSGWNSNIRDELKKLDIEGLHHDTV